METPRNKMNANYSNIIGQDGENIAVKYLKSKEYEIMDRNYKSKYGEIDIIARYKDEIVFTEVKRRKNTDFGLASQSVDIRKQEKIIKSAQIYISEKCMDFDYSFRFDVLEITGKNLQIHHIENAFRVY